MRDEKPKRRQVEYTSGSSTWAYILIALGVFWLLVNLDIFAGFWRLWPVILVVFGVLMLTGVVQASAPEKHHFTAPLGDTNSARMKLSLAVGQGVVKALKESDALIDADLAHRGEVEFAVTGERDKIVILRPTESANWQWLNPANWFKFQQDLKWDIGLTNRVPLDMTVNCGVGKSMIDLTGIKLTGLNATTGLGSTELLLPCMDTPYDVQINGGTGEIQVDIAEGAALTMKVRGGIGGFKVNTPHDAAVRIKATMGVGDVNLSSRFVQTGGGRHLVGESGVWQTEGYETAARQVTIDFEGGVGELRVR